MTKQAPPPREYEVAITYSNGMTKFNSDNTVEIVGRSLTIDELAVIATINEAISRLKNGKLTSYNFDPRSFEQATEMIKCEWLRSGNLKVHGPTETIYHYVEKRDEALKEHRTFTCPRALLIDLPKHRDITGVYWK